MGLFRIILSVWCTRHYVWEMCQFVHVRNVEWSGNDCIGCLSCFHHTISYIICIHILRCVGNRCMSVYMIIMYMVVDHLYHFYLDHSFPLPHQLGSIGVFCFVETICAIFQGAQARREWRCNEVERYLCVWTYWFGGSCTWNKSENQLIVNVRASFFTWFLNY